MKSACPFSTPTPGIEHPADVLSKKGLFFLFSSGVGLGRIIPADPEVTVLKRLFCLALLAAAIWAPMPSFAQQASQERIPQEKEQVLWQKLEATISGVDRNLDGVLGVAILDLTTGQKYFLHADEVLPTASSIKIAILTELYHQAHQGKPNLASPYTLPSSLLSHSGELPGPRTPH